MSVLQRNSGSTSYLFVERIEKDRCLHRLPQAHLISQDGVSALRPGEAQPVQALHLIGVQGSARGVQVFGLSLILHCWLKEETGSQVLART